MVRIILYTIILMILISSPERAKGIEIPNSMFDQRMVQEPGVDSIIQNYLNEIDSNKIRNYMQGLVDFETRFMLAENRKEIALWLAGKFKSFGYDDVKVDSFQNVIEFPLKSGEHKKSWQYNVKAVLPGRVDSNKVYLLGAHYDCFIMGPGTDPYVFAPGANNNGSGVAVCLEIARILKQKDFRPKYAIYFMAFGSEEFMTMFVEGKSGSDNFVSDFGKTGKTIAMMIDNNQIAYCPQGEEWRLDFQNCPGSEEVTELAHYLCHRYTKIVPNDTSDHINYTDAYFFWSAGYPTIFFEEYHFCPYTFTEKDIIENCNLSYCREAAKISCALLVYSNY
ncbi:putative Bacterial leucyl aminopeptidase [Candidatus Zixiibacteriota bacterium]|nr:putative Bacterial leucyl aminopeptidase [candidate division Zixibacteria bacterium]